MSPLRTSEPSARDEVLKRPRGRDQKPARQVRDDDVGRSDVGRSQIRDEQRRFGLRIEFQILARRCDRIRIVIDRRQTRLAPSRLAAIARTPDPVPTSSTVLPADIQPLQRIDAQARRGVVTGAEAHGWLNDHEIIRRTGRRGRHEPSCLDPRMSQGARR